MICEQCGEMIIGNVCYCKKCGSPLPKGIIIDKEPVEKVKINSMIKNAGIASPKKRFIDKEEWSILTRRFSKEAIIKRSKLPLTDRINIELLMKLDIVSFAICVHLMTIIILLILILAKLIDGIRVW